MPFIAPDCPPHQVFKANSAILNTLLTLLNERLFDDGATRECVPLLSAVAASNEGASSDGLPDCLPDDLPDCPTDSPLLIAPLIALQLASDGPYLPLIIP